MADQETEQLRQTVRELSDALTELQRSGTLSDRSLRNLKRAQDDLASQTEDNRDALEKAEDALKDFYRGTKQAASGLGETLQQVRENREQFNTLNPAIGATSQVLQSTAGAVGNMSTAVGAVVGGLTALIPGVGLVASVFTGLAASKITEAFGGVSQEAVKAGEAFFRLSTGQLDRVVGAFRQLGSVGAVTADGIDGLYDASVQAGLSVNQFSQLVSNNARSLAFATGSATESARAIAEITQAAKPFQDQLLALGMGLTEQSEAFADYIVMSRRLGRQQTRDYATLAAGAAEYAFELDELSRLTGMSTDEAQKALEAQMSNTRFRATLAKAEAAGGQDLVKAIRGTATAVEAFGGKRLAEGFQDAFGGPATQAARQFEIATGGAGREIVERLRSGAISQDQALEQIQQSIQGRLQSLGGMDFVERVGKIGTIMDPMLLEMIEFSQRAGVTAEDMERLREEQRKARLEQTENTKEVVTAQQSLQGLAMQVDAIVKDLVFPNAATAVKSFTEVMETSIRTLADTAGIEVAGERAAGGPVTGGEPYLVGELGPELIVPSSSGTVIPNDQLVSSANTVTQTPQLDFSPLQNQIDSLSFSSTGLQAQDIESRLDTVRQALADVPRFVEGFKSAFLPGIGEVAEYAAGGLSTMMIKTLDGQIEEYARYNVPTSGMTLEAYRAGGQAFAQGTYEFGDYQAQTGFTNVGGPRTMYDSIMADVNPNDDATVGVRDRGTGEMQTANINDNRELLELMKTLNANMQQVASNTRTGADTSKKLLRASTG